MQDQERLAPTNTPTQGHANQAALDNVLWRLSAAEDRYRALVQATGNIAWTATPDGPMADVAAWCIYTGQRPSPRRDPAGPGHARHERRGGHPPPARRPRATQRIPMVAMSAGTGLAAAGAAMAANAVLSKPFDLDDLLGVVARWATAPNP